MTALCFCVLSKAVIGAAKATHIQLGNADLTDGCNGESVHPTDIEAMLYCQLSDLIGRTFIMDV